jgi:hypothetical protein
MNWSEITIGQYQQLVSIQNGVYEFGIEKEIAVLSCITGKPTEELEELPKDKLIELAKVTKFINDPISDTLKPIFKCGGKTYNVLMNAEKISTEQFILLNRYTENEANTIDNLHYILAVLTNEKQYWWSSNVHRFDYNFEEKAKLFKDKLSIEMAHAPAVFFCKVYKSWLEITETYLLEKMKGIVTKAKEELRTLEERK